MKRNAKKARPAPIVPMSGFSALNKTSPRTNNANNSQKLPSSIGYLLAEAAVNAVLNRLGFPASSQSTGPVESSVKGKEPEEDPTINESDNSDQKHGPDLAVGKDLSEAGMEDGWEDYEGRSRESHDGLRNWSSRYDNERCHTGPVTGMADELHDDLHHDIPPGMRSCAQHVEVAMETGRQIAAANGNPVAAGLSPTRRAGTSAGEKIADGIVCCPAGSGDSESDMAASEDLYLPISAVADMVYCPRAFYYRMVEGANDENADMLEGRLQEEHRSQRQTVSSDGTKQMRTVRLRSDLLKVIGVADAVEEGDAIVPVEFKKGHLRNQLSHDIQVCLQGMALEEMWNISIEQAYIYYAESRSRREVILDDSLRELAIRAVHDARSLLEGNEIPDPLADSRCERCSLRERCSPFETAVLNGRISSDCDMRRVPRPLPSRHLGRVLYVDVPGARIRCEGQRFVVDADGHRVMEVPAINVDEVVLLTGANWTPQSMRLALKRGVPISILSGSGRLVGRVVPPMSKNGLLRQAQYRQFSTPEMRLSLARTLVAGKVSNMRTLLLRQRRGSGMTDKVDEALGRLRDLNQDILAASDEASLLGFEGNASRLYFQALSHFFRHPQGESAFTFTNRNRRPPRDPINAMLSFGYAMLLKNILSAIEIVGLDPYTGFYHTSKYARPALALDIMEEFRACVVDALVLALVNRGMVKSQDFENQPGSCYLGSRGRKVFVNAFEVKLGEEITHPYFGYRVAYRRIIELQVRFLARYISGELPEYRTFLTR